MTADQLAALLEKATNALADIASLLDEQNGRSNANIHAAERKARRHYDELRAVWEGPGAEDETPQEEPTSRALLLHATFLVGSIGEAIAEAHRLARRLDCGVRFLFNDTSIDVLPDSDEVLVQQGYFNRRGIER